MNVTVDDEDGPWTTKAIWQRAEHPDVGVTFFALSGIWLAINFTIGVFCNGAVLVTYFKNAEVSYFAIIVGNGYLYAQVSPCLQCTHTCARTLS